MKLQGFAFDGLDIHKNGREMHMSCGTLGESSDDESLDARRLIFVDY